MRAFEDDWLETLESEDSKSFDDSSCSPETTEFCSRRLANGVTVKRRRLLIVGEQTFEPWPARVKGFDREFKPARKAIRWWKGDLA